VNTSALLATGLRRKGMRPGMLRSAGAALTVVTAATLDRGLIIRLDDSPDVTGHVTSTQTLLPHLLLIGCAQVGIFSQT
jgi:hypothetical protein